MISNQLHIFDHFASPGLISAFPNYEFEELEYKAAAGGFPEDFWKTYSAFANTSGGVIILGVRERKGKLVVEGLEDQQINNYKKHFWNNANNPNTVSISLLANDDVQQFDMEGKAVLAFRIPSAARTQRPVYLTRNPFDNTYKRNHEGDYRCSKEEVRRLLADADINTHHDSRILDGFTIDDIDSNSLKQYRQLFATAKPGHAWLVLEDKEFLMKLVHLQFNY